MMSTNERNNHKADFLSEIAKILLPLKTERIAEIWCEVNVYKIPRELKDVSPFDSTGKERFPHDYWKIFNEFIRKIVTEQDITKAHYRNLLKEEFDFGYEYREYQYYQERNEEFPEETKK